MNGRIIVGYDGSDPSSEAAFWAAGAAAIRGWPLHILSCFDTTGVLGDPMLVAGTYLDVMRDDATEALDALVARIEAGSDVDITSEVLGGDPASSLLHLATADDLLVVGSSSHDQTAAFWLGTTPRQLVRRSPCPIVVVRGAASRGRPDRVVVGIDNSEASDHALRWAGAEADRHGVELAVVHAWSYDYTSSDVVPSRGRELTEIDAACSLERSAEIASEKFATNATSTLIEGGAVSVLLDFIRDGDLLVLGSRGRGALRTRLFGSTVNSVLDHAAVPVAVIPHGAD